MRYILFPIINFFFFLLAPYGNGATQADTDELVKQIANDPAFPSELNVSTAGKTDAEVAALVSNIMQDPAFKKHMQSQASDDLTKRQGAPLEKQYNSATSEYNKWYSFHDNSQVKSKPSKKHLTDASEELARVICLLANPHGNQEKDLIPHQSALLSLGERMKASTQRIKEFHHIYTHDFPSLTNSLNELLPLEDLEEYIKATDTDHTTETTTPIVASLEKLRSTHNPITNTSKYASTATSLEKPRKKGRTKRTKPK